MAPFTVAGILQQLEDIVGDQLQVLSQPRPDTCAQRIGLCGLNEHPSAKMRRPRPELLPPPCSPPLCAGGHVQVAGPPFQRALRHLQTHPL